MRMHPEGTDMSNSSEEGNTSLDFFIKYTCASKILNLIMFLRKMLWCQIIISIAYSKKDLLSLLLLK